MRRSPFRKNFCRPLVTRTRVLRAIEELMCGLNPRAGSLAGGKSRSAGAIVSSIENPVFLDIFKAVEDGAHRAAYELIAAYRDYISGRLPASVRGRPGIPP